MKSPDKTPQLASEYLVALTRVGTNDEKAGKIASAIMQALKISRYVDSTDLVDITTKIIKLMQAEIETDSSGEAMSPRSESIEQYAKGIVKALTIQPDSPPGHRMAVNAMFRNFPVIGATVDRLRDALAMIDTEPPQETIR